MRPIPGFAGPSGKANLNTPTTRSPRACGAGHRCLRPGGDRQRGPQGGAAWKPTGPITMVVPFAAGGPTDTVTRTVAEPMSTALGQQIVVTNVAGAGGTLAAGQVATAAADGYTVLMHHIGMSTAPSLYADLAYDPLTSTSRPSASSPRSR